MISIDEVDIGMTGRAEQHGVAQGAAGGGVSSGIFGAEVRFDLDDTGGESEAGKFSDQDLAQELAGYAAGVASEEGAGEGMYLGRGAGGFRTGHAGKMVNGLARFCPLVQGPLRSVH
jgi:hypothetical protein